jgi:hypothetical protein
MFSSSLTWESVRNSGLWRRHSGIFTAVRAGRAWPYKSDRAADIDRGHALSSDSDSASGVGCLVLRDDVRGNPATWGNRDPLPDSPFPDRRGARAGSTRRSARPGFTAALGLTRRPCSINSVKALRRAAAFFLLRSISKIDPSRPECHRLGCLADVEIINQQG